MLRALLLAVAAVVLIPDSAWAWGPATHVYLGTEVLRSLVLLPPAIRALLGAFPKDFLYGSVAADISLAKKYVPEGRHCHNWHIGEEILATAETDRLRAVGYGYLSHLAADTVAHNLFVPRQLLLTSSSKALGHSYWEHRMDVQLGERFTRVARDVVMDHDHSAADALFDRVLSATLFSFQTNRRIFRGMIRFQDNDRWQSIFGTIRQNSRWSLSESAIHDYTALSFDYIIDYLNRRGSAIPAGMDPIGDQNLSISKRVRRMAINEGKLNSPRLMEEMADNFFPLPEKPFNYLARPRVEREAS
ncbi:MAG: zinc dependent phospholipase C family protein [Gemmatimonadota bacterium]|nr:zinc dependent phospholipase C family protein [Gemmatimonadota bacterium]